MQCCPNCGISLKRFEAFHYGNVTLTETSEILFKNQRVYLSPTIKLMVETIIRAEGRVMGREALLNVIGAEEGDHRTIDAYVRRARLAFEKIFPDFDQLPNVRGRHYSNTGGYRWDFRPEQPLRAVA